MAPLAAPVQLLVPDDVHAARHDRQEEQELLVLSPPPTCPSSLSMVERPSSCSLREGIKKPCCLRVGPQGRGPLASGPGRWPCMGRPSLSMMVISRIEAPISWFISWVEVLEQFQCDS